MSATAEALAVLAEEAVVLDDADLLRWALLGDTAAEAALRLRASTSSTAGALVRALDRGRVAVVRCCERCGASTVRAAGLCLGCLDGAEPLPVEVAVPSRAESAPPAHRGACD